MKKFANPNTISTHDCNVCLIQDVTTLSVKGTAEEKLDPTKKCYWAKKKVWNYNTIESLSYEPVLFHDVKYLGFTPMHKKIRPVENVCKLSERKHAFLNFPELYNNPKTSQQAISMSREIFKKQFKDLLSIKYFVPDPINGGNSNTGPMMKKMLASPSVSAQILGISPVLLYRLKKCTSFINRISFVKPHIFEKFASAALRSILAELGSFGSLSASTHSLLCHGGLYIRWAQEEVGVALGDLTENSIEMGNKENLAFRKLMSRKCSLEKETWDIFRRKSLVSDPKLIIEGSFGQVLRRGNVLKSRRADGPEPEPEPENEPAL